MSSFSDKKDGRDFSFQLNNLAYVCRLRKSFMTEEAYYTCTEFKKMGEHFLRDGEKIYIKDWSGRKDPVSNVLEKESNFIEKGTVSYVRVFGAYWKKFPGPFLTVDEVMNEVKD